MGNRLSPMTAKSTEIGTSKSGALRYAASAMQGRRSQMEDAHLAIPDLFHEEHDHNLDGHALFAVFDGHGGSSASRFAAKALPGILLAHASMEKYKQLAVSPAQQLGKDAAKANAALSSAKKQLLKQILEDTFIEIDRRYLLARNQAMLAKQQRDASSNGAGKKRNFKDPGTTALVVLVTPDFVVCANAGDCRAMLIQDEPSLRDDDDSPPPPSPPPRKKSSATVTTTTTLSTVTTAPRRSSSMLSRTLARRTSSFVELSQDHRPDGPSEEKRIQKAGGYVFGGRLEDDLAVSRGFGDFRYKEDHITLHGVCEQSQRTVADQKVSPLPEIKFLSRQQTPHKFLFLGCDGVFEQMSNDKVCRTLSERLQTETLEGACHQLLDKSLRKGSKDNMTALVVQLYHQTAADTDASERSQDSPYR